MKISGEKYIFNLIIDFGLSAINENLEKETLNNLLTDSISSDDRILEGNPFLSKGFMRKRPNFNHTTCGTLSYIAPEILGLVDTD